MKNKTKKIKIISVLILLFVTTISAVIITLSFTKTSYMMQINKPSRIIVYCNNETNNIVFEKDDSEYMKIYSLLVDSYKQTTLTAIFAGEISKNVQVVKGSSTDVNFNGIKISFVYDLPQFVKLKNKTYVDNGENYWYQNLIFNITNSDKFKYNTVAIIPPSNSTEYLGQFTYNMQYNVFSNFKKLYDYSSNLF